MNNSDNKRKINWLTKTCEMTRTIEELLSKRYLHIHFEEQKIPKSRNTHTDLRKKIFRIKTEADDYSGNVSPRRLWSFLKEIIFELQTCQVSRLWQITRIFENLQYHAGKTKKLAMSRIFRKCQGFFANVKDFSQMSRIFRIHLVEEFV